MIIRELITKLGFSVDSAALKRGEDAVNNIKNRTNEVSEAAKGATSNIGLMLQAYLSFASASSLARVADAAQSLRARLAMVPQTVGDAGAAFDELAERANFARTSINAYGTLYVRLAGATKDYLKTQEEVLTVTDAISQALAVNGATTEEAASVTLQLSQAFQKGKLDGDEFRSFMEGLSTDFKEKMVVALQDVTGNANITVGALYDMSANGELVAKDLALAFKKMAPEIRKQMLSIPLTIGGATQIVRNDFTAMIDRMNRESMAVTRIAGTIVKSFDLIEAGIYKVKDVFGGFGNVVRLVGVALAILVSAKIIKGIRAIAAAGVLASAPWLPMAAVITAVTLAVEDLYTYIKGGQSVFGGLVKWMQDAWDVYERTWNKIGNFRDRIYSKVGAAFDAAGNLVMGGLNMSAQGMAAQNVGISNLGMRPSQSHRYEVNVTLPPRSTPDQVPLWTAEVEKAIDKTIARNITSTVGGR
jgi:tape measure domain-containing protein